MTHRIMFRRRKRVKIRVTPGFLLLSALLLYLDQTVGLLRWGVLTAFFHELGHILAARYFGGKVEELSLTMTGAELKFSYPAVLSYGAESLIALAGPAANLLIGAAAAAFGIPLLAMTGFAVGLLNLIPVPPLDGGRIFYNTLCEWAGIRASEIATSACSGVFIGIMLGVGLIAAIHYANVVLLILAGWLLGGMMMGKHNFSPK